MTASPRTGRTRRLLSGSAAAFAMLALPTLPVQAHEQDCSKDAGLQRARCERHQRMYAKCSPVQGDAHYACDREFLVANPLACRTLALSADETRRCEAEVAAFKTCEAKPGREFMRCVRDTTKESPNGG